MQGINEFIFMRKTGGEEKEILSNIEREKEEKKKKISRWQIKKNISEKIEQNLWAVSKN